MKYMPEERHNNVNRLIGSLMGIKAEFQDARMQMNTEFEKELEAEITILIRYVNGDNV